MVQPKLLIIGPTPPPFHGVSVAMATLLESPLRQQFQLLHLDLADRRGIQHVDKPDLHDVLLFLRQWVRLMRILLIDRPGLVYLALSQSTIGFLRDSFFIWPASIFGARVVIHLHGGNFHTWYLGRSWIMRTYGRAVMKRVAQGIVLGESLKGLFAGLIRHDRITVVPNGISWPSTSTLSINLEKARRYRILHLSTLNRFKGALALIAALPYVVRVRNDVEFIFAGPWSDPGDQRKAKCILSEENLTQFVTFTGPVITMEHKCALYRSADVFVFPGIQQEGQPLVVLEAMAAGLPVLFTDRGCLKDTVGEGEAGFEVRIDDPQHLADRLLWLLDHPEEMRVMGDNARKRFEAFYTAGRFVANMTQVLTRVTGEVP